MNPIIITILIIVGCIPILSVFLIAPSFSRKAKKVKKAPFYGKNFAHRGLYEKDQSIPENSLAAFDRAASAGYGMELDVQLSRDRKVVVFHDDNLKRMCGIDKKVNELDFDELQKLSLCGTDQKIPLFSEVLEMVNGRTPLIVELKICRHGRQLCKKTLKLLKEYDKEYCIESFNPMIVAWFRFHAPRIFRGQLAQQPNEYKKEGLPKLAGMILGYTMFNIAARPDFIAYRIGKKPLAIRTAEALGAVKVAWTSHSAETEKNFDAVIFEHYLPEIKFKEMTERRSRKDQ